MGLITWSGRSCTRVTFSESRSQKDMLRKEYIQQKEKETLYMRLFVFMSGVKFLGFCWERNWVDKLKKFEEKEKSCPKEEIDL